MYLCYREIVTPVFHPIHKFKFPCISLHSYHYQSKCYVHTALLKIQPAIHCFEFNECTHISKEMVGAALAMHFIIQTGIFEYYYIMFKYNVRCPK